MKTRKRLGGRLSTKQRMYLSYCLICFIPVVILTGALSLFTLRSNHREKSAKQAHMAELAGRSLDSTFERAQSLGQMLSEARWVKHRGAAPGLYDEEFDLTSKLDICQDLRGYVGSNGAIRHISVVFPQKEEVYSSAGFYSAENFFHSFSLEQGQPPLEPAQVYERLPANGALLPGSALGMTGSSGQKLFALEALEYNTPMRCFLLVEFDCSAIRNQLGLLDLEGLSSIAVMNGESPLLVLETENSPGKETYSYRSTCFPVDILASFSQIPPIDLQGIWLVLLPLILSLILAGQLAILLTQASYRPLKALVDQVSNRVPAGSRAENEYELIEQSLSQLYLDRENVQQVAQRYRSTARENLLRQLLQGYFDPEKAAGKMQEFDIAFTEELAVLVLLVEENAPCKPLEEALSTFDCLYEIAELSKTRLAAILAFPPETPLEPRAVVQRVLLSYEEMYEQKPTVAYGPVEQGILGISKSYYTASQYLAARLSTHERFSPPDKIFYYPTEWELQLIGRIKAGQQAMSQTILREIQGENQRRGVSRLHQHQLVMMLCQTYSRMIQELDSQPERYAPLFRQVELADTVEGLWDALYRINDQFCAERAAPEKAEDAEALIVSYVQEHLTDPELSLKTLGDRFDLSVSAVSKLFKRVCGINFYDFLLSRRMELACEMLKNNKLSPPAVARAVGYENEYSFKRAFSRFYGMSLSEYLKKNKHS